MTPLLEASDAAFRYVGSPAPVGPFSLAVRAGELHHVRGPSGCGKSTFARLLAGLIPHLYRGDHAGAVRAGGRRTTEVPLWELSSRVGLVGQNPAAQVLAATVADEILFGLETLGLSRGEMTARLESTLDAFGLHTLRDRDPRTLSGGEQQKAVLAAVAARRPQVIVLDEACSMLDVAAARGVRVHVQRLRHDGTAAVVFEHRPAVDAWGLDACRHVIAPEPPDTAVLPALPCSVPPCAFEIRGLTVSRGGRRVVDAIDLACHGGQALALVGPNGAGKTTVLRALAGVQRYAGSVCGHLPRLGLCFQNPDQQIFNPTVREEILYGNPSVDPTFYRHVVDLLGLGPYEDTAPMLLSEGQKKRLGVAILLVRPGLQGLCLDEPTLGQDSTHRRRIGRVVRHLVAAGYLCVVATHDLEWAAEWCDAVVHLEAGRVTAAPAVPQ